MLIFLIVWYSGKETEGFFYDHYGQGALPCEDASKQIWEWDCASKRSSTQRAWLLRKWRCKKQSTSFFYKERPAFDILQIKGHLNSMLNLKWNLTWYITCIITKIRRKKPCIFQKTMRRFYFQIIEYILHA